MLQHIFVSSGKTYLSTMSSSQKVVIEPTAGVNETKICLKFQKIANIPIYNAIILILLNFSMHFPKIHRSVLPKIRIDLLYF